MKRLFDFISPRGLGTLGVFVGLGAIGADHLPQMHTDDHGLTLGGVAAAAIALLVRILADQSRGFRSLRSVDERQGQDLEALKSDMMEVRPNGNVARLLRSRVVQSSEFEAPK